MRIMKVFAMLMAVVCAIITLSSCVENNSEPHVHNFSVENVSEDYLAAEASCDTPATYYYSCEC